MPERELEYVVRFRTEAITELDAAKTALRDLQSTTAESATQASDLSQEFQDFKAGDELKRISQELKNFDSPIISGVENFEKLGDQVSDLKALLQDLEDTRPDVALSPGKAGSEFAELTKEVEKFERKIAAATEGDFPGVLVQKDPLLDEVQEAVEGIDEFIQTVEKVDKVDLNVGTKRIKSEFSDVADSLDDSIERLKQSGAESLPQLLEVAEFSVQDLKDEIAGLKDVSPEDLPEAIERLSQRSEDAIDNVEDLTTATKDLEVPLDSIDGVAARAIGSVTGNADAAFRKIGRLRTRVSQLKFALGAVGLGFVLPDLFDAATRKLQRLVDVSEEEAKRIDRIKKAGEGAAEALDLLTFVESFEEGSALFSEADRKLVALQQAANEARPALRRVAEQAEESAERINRAFDVPEGATPTPVVSGEAIRLIVLEALRKPSLKRIINEAQEQGEGPGAAALDEIEFLKEGVERADKSAIELARSFLKVGEGARSGADNAIAALKEMRDETEFLERAAREGFSPERIEQERAAREARAQIAVPDEAAIRAQIEKNLADLRTRLQPITLTRDGVSEERQLSEEARESIREAIESENKRLAVLSDQVAAKRAQADEAEALEERQREANATLERAWEIDQLRFALAQEAVQRRQDFLRSIDTEISGLEATGDLLKVHNRDRERAAELIRVANDAVASGIEAGSREFDEILEQYDEALKKQEELIKQSQTFAEGWERAAERFADAAEDAAARAERAFDLVVGGAEDLLAKAATGGLERDDLEAFLDDFREQQARNLFQRVAGPLLRPGDQEGQLDPLAVATGAGQRAQELRDAVGIPLQTTIQLTSDEEKLILQTIDATLKSQTGQIVGAISSGAATSGAGDAAQSATSAAGAVTVSSDGGSSDTVSQASGWLDLILGVAGIASLFLDEGTPNTSLSRGSVVRPASSFLRAGRYQMGGMTPGSKTSGMEIPAILHPNEAVIPLDPNSRIPLEVRNGKIVVPLPGFGREVKVAAPKFATGFNGNVGGPGSPGLQFGAGNQPQITGPKASPGAGQGSLSGFDVGGLAGGVAGLSALVGIIIGVLNLFSSAGELSGPTKVSVADARVTRRGLGLSAKADAEDEPSDRLPLNILGTARQLLGGGSLTGSLVGSSQFQIPQVNPAVGDVLGGAVDALLGDRKTIGTDAASDFLKAGSESSLSDGKFRFGAFAGGGVIDRPTLALMGERTPEAVIPLAGGSVPVQLSSPPAAPVAPVIATMNINVTTPDADSFRANQSQIASVTASSLQRALTRNS